MSTTTVPPADVRPKKRARPTDSTSSPAEITDSDRWTVGDVELISSDNVRFRAPAYLLQSNSAVFRGLISGKDKNVKCLRFTDHTIEDSTVLDDFLDLLITSRTPLSISSCDVVGWYNDPSPGRYTALLRFLIKYNCVLAKGMFLAAAYGHMPYGSISPALCYALGAIGDDQDLCIAALHLANRFAASDCAKEFDFEEDARRDKVGIRPDDFDSAAWSLVPEKYQLVLRQTLEKATLGHIGPVALRNEFDDALDEYYRMPSWS